MLALLHFQSKVYIHKMRVSQPTNHPGSQPFVCTTCNFPNTRINAMPANSTGSKNSNFQHKYMVLLILCATLHLHSFHFPFACTCFLMCLSYCWSCWCCCCCCWNVVENAFWMNWTRSRFDDLVCIAISIKFKIQWKKSLCVCACMCACVYVSSAFFPVRVI